MSAAVSKLPNKKKKSADDVAVIDAHAKLMLFYRYSVQATYTLAAFDPTLYDGDGPRDEQDAAVLCDESYINESVMQRVHANELHSARALVFVLLGCHAPYKSFSSAAEMANAWLAVRHVPPTSLLYYVCTHAFSHFPSEQPVVTARRFIDKLPAAVSQDKRSYHLNSVRVHRQELVKQLLQTPSAVLSVEPGLDQTVMQILHALNDTHATLLQRTGSFSIDALSQLYGRSNEAKLWLLDAKNALAAFQIRHVTSPHFAHPWQ